MTNPDIFIDKEGVTAIARRVEKIADAMPKGLSKVESAADRTLAANQDSSAATALTYRLQEWKDQYDLLTRQVAGFAADLHGAVTTWDQIEGANTEIFSKYGKEL